KLQFTYAVMPTDNTSDLQVAGLNLPADASITGSDGNGSLTGVVSGDLGISVHGNLLPADVAEEINGLYVGLYDVAARRAGVGFWINVAATIDPSITQANASSTAASAAVANFLGQQFVQTQSTYFNQLYATLTDSQFVLALYQNLTDSDGSAGGQQYWLNILT